MCNPVTPSQLFNALKIVFLALESVSTHNGRLPHYEGEDNPSTFAELVAQFNQGANLPQEAIDAAMTTTPQTVVEMLLTAKEGNQ